MFKKPKILVIGSFVMDLTVSTQKFPNSGETVFGESFQTAPGGKGANQAIQAAKLGADVTMVGKVGKDDFGKRLIRSCAEAGIKTDRILVDNDTSSAVGNVLLEVGERKATKNRIIVVPGTNMTIMPEDVSFLKDTINQYDMVILQLEIPQKIDRIVAKYAFNKGVPVMLNPAPSAALPDDFLSCLTYISPNEHEAADLTGVKIRKNGKNANNDDVRAAVRILLDKGIQNVVITLGNAGAVVANQKEYIYRPCIDVVEVKDPTAAGDSFVGAFSTGICAGMNPEQALDFANYTATLTVSKAGAQPSLPRLEDVLCLMKQQNYSNLNNSAINILK